MTPGRKCQAGWSLLLLRAIRTLEGTGSGGLTPFHLFVGCYLTLGPVVQMPVSANPGLNFNPGFFFFLSKAHYRIIFSILFRVSSHQIVGKEN